MAVAADGTMTGDTNNTGELGTNEAMPGSQPAQNGMMGYARSPQGKRFFAQGRGSGETSLSRNIG